MSDEQPLKEVASMREVPRTPEHCGKPMRRLRGVATATGVVNTVYVCARECGHQEKHDE
jgi:hypothetical protein